MHKELRRVTPQMFGGVVDDKLDDTGAIRKAFAENPSVFDPRKYCGPARELIKETVQHKIRDVFGSSNKA